MLPVSVSILSNNRLDEVSKNVPRMLSEMNHEGEFEMIVVDNDSTDGTKSFLQEHQVQHPELKIILRNSNDGTAVGRNMGFALANRQYVIVMDDDAYVSAEDLRKIPALFDKYSEAGLLSFRIKHPITNQIQNPHGDKPKEITHHHGACFGIRKSVLETIGGVDEQCDYGGEEPDLSIRVRLAGWKVLYVPDITALHNSVNRNNREESWRHERRIYHKIRLFYKYFPWYMASLFAFRHFTVSIIGWYRCLGFTNIFNGFRAARAAIIKGSSSKQKLPAEIIELYRDKHSRPEFGNIPLSYKVVSYLKRKSA